MGDDAGTDALEYELGYVAKGDVKVIQVRREDAEQADEQSKAVHAQVLPRDGVTFYNAET